MTRTIHGSQGKNPATPGDAPLPATPGLARPRPSRGRLPLAWFILAVAAATLVCWWFFDAPVAAWALRVHPIPDLANPAARGGDIARELMMLEQWGQWVCSVLVIAAVAILDRTDGRRNALAIALGCLSTVAASYLLKDMIGRSRPYVLPANGTWTWGGPAMGFHHGSAWQSFPSSHTTGAFALSVGLAWCYPRGAALFLALAAITAAQRVLHAAHFLSDVFAGMGLAVVIPLLTLRARLADRLVAALPQPSRRWFQTPSTPAPPLND
ncbi:MAG TPA: phosphatase PAP2 family protein [Phycisphaerae bacterium]|nr:phosphatase PAP2 family protein [Phycisphaerae bacterium]